MGFLLLLAARFVATLVDPLVGDPFAPLEHRASTMEGVVIRFAVGQKVEPKSGVPFGGRDGSTETREGRVATGLDFVQINHKCGDTVTILGRPRRVFGVVKVSLVEAANAI